jgi:hypothetical protein
MAVDNFVHKMDCNAWHSIEKFSYKHPVMARMSSVPLALAVFVKTIVAAPAKFIEECVLIGKSIRAYKVEKEQKLYSMRKRNILIHSASALKNAASTVMSPLNGAIKAILIFAKMVFMPLKTAKMKAANNEFRLLLKEKKYVSRKTIEDGRLIDFASEKEFASAAIHQFKKQISAAKTSEQMFNIHFINDEDSKAQLIADIALKKQKFQRGRAIYEGLVASENDVSDEQKAKWLAEWQDFQKHLISATHEDAPKMVFTPSLLPAE